MEDATITDSKTYNLFVTLLEGKTLTLKFNTPNVAADSIKRRLLEVTKIPLRHQRLVTGTRQLADDSVISCSSSAADAPCFPTVSLLLRLVGGKGGFGSLLRGAATKAGQKKTSNFDACRDMSGRRLRHVNAEKKLEEWRAEAEERRLEKAAEEFLNNLAKKGKKGSGDAAAEKYVARYKKESERCVEEVLNSVKEGLKRKGSAKESFSASKKLKFWMGKSKGESDSEDDDSDNEDKKEKSIVLNSAGSSDSSKEEGSLDSVSDRKHDAEGGSEEEREIVVQATLDFGGSPGEESLQTEKIVGSASVSCSEPDVVLGPEPLQDEKMVCSEPEMDNLEEVVSRSPDGSSSGDGQGVESIPIVSEANGLSESNPGVLDEKAASGKTLEPEKPLNFDEFNSAAEMEVLGLERLKTELQARGLKCGGTLQERASRLFMLKSTPIEKIPKKLLAKK